MTIKYEYDKAALKATVCGVIDCGANVVIPATVEYYNKVYKVKSIEKKAFYNCKALESIVIPNSVTSIGERAFECCRSLTSVTIPNSVTSIGESAFEGCSSLKEVHITDLAAWCNIDFNDCYSTPLYYAKNQYLNGELVTNIVIPEWVTEIKNYAFSCCSSLKSVTIPNSVTYIGSSAFSSCSSLTSVTIPNSVRSIGDSTFSDCSSLTSVTIPNSVTSIKDSTFYGCSSLTSVTIPNSVTSIGFTAFFDCSSLTSVTIPNSVTSIKDCTFYGCSSLTSVTIPNSVTSIGYCAFNGCSSLTSVTIPNSVTSIGNCAFEGCESLKQVDICNEIGELLIHSMAFDDDVKINYLGKKTVNKTTEVKKTEVASAQTKEQTPVIDLDKLMDAVVVDGVITDKERSVILKKATAAGYDADEVEILLDAKLAEKLNANKATAAEPQKKVEPAKKEPAPVAKDATSEEKSGNGARDYSKYAVNGEGKYGKGRMVEAVINKYVELNPNVTVQKLKEVFPERLQGSNFIKDSTETITDMKRYYESALPGGAKFYISNQWGTQTDAFVEYVNKNIDGITVSKL